MKHVSNLIIHQKSHMEMTIMITKQSKANDHLNMHSMKHNSMGIYACPKHKYDAIQENKHKEKQTK